LAILRLLLERVDALLRVLALALRERRPDGHAVDLELVGGQHGGVARLAERLHPAGPVAAQKARLGDAAPRARELELRGLAEALRGLVELAHGEQRLAERVERVRLVGTELRVLLELGDGQVEAALLEVEVAERVVDDGGRRAERRGLAEGLLGLVVLLLVE